MLDIILQMFSVLIDKKIVGTVFRLLTCHLMIRLSLFFS
jgi:hypothetical protein